MNKIYYTWEQVEGACIELARQIRASKWEPDYIVGITRGGLIPAVMISQYFNIPLHTLNVSLRDADIGPESNLWMAEDALGPLSKERTVNNDTTFKNILVVDDINDQGTTLNWIMQDWPSGCFPDDPAWEEVWNNNVKFAVLVDNLASRCNVKMDFVGMEVNKAEKDIWIDFPWEDWWTK